MTEDDTFRALTRMPFKQVYTRWIELNYPRDKQFVIDNGWNYLDFDEECFQNKLMSPQGLDHDMH